MSDPYATRTQARGLEQTRTIERPAHFLPYAQRAVNPVAATSNPGDFAQPWPANLLAFYVTAVVLTTNNGANFWTIQINDLAGNVLASVDTSGLTANVWGRLSDLTVVQPVSTNSLISLVATTTGAPGNLFLVPSVSALRTGN